MTSDKDYWDTRSKRYNNLNWTNDYEYLSSLMRFCDIEMNHNVLDIGAGTGIIGCACEGNCNTVIGIDNNLEMINQSRSSTHIIPGDIRDMPFPDNVFDRAIGRLVFHHITNGAEKAIDECSRVLTQDGKLIISEGVPPHDDLKDDYKEIFKIKENRVTFLEEDLVELLSGKFKNIETSTFIQRQASVNNWLYNDSSVTDRKRKEIIYLHRNSSPLFKKAYNLTDTGDDILIDLKFLSVKGTNNKE